MSKKTCSVQGCRKPYLAKGLCSAHYTRLIRHGSLINPRDGDLRVEENSEFITETGCRIWTGNLDRGEYGRTSIFGKDFRMHRYTYEREFGPIPEGLLVCHRCDVRCCINPNHLFLGTTQDNTDDMVKKSRQVKGTDNHAAKVNEEIVKEIRSCDLNYPQLVKKYGLNIKTIWDIRRRNSWKHVP